MASPFRLNSNQTALAFLVPENLQAEINSLRRIHDKAFAKWQPHINVIYPFVDPSNLSSATTILRETLRYEVPVKLNTHEVGVFQHRRNATIFLRSSVEVEGIVRDLRVRLLKSIERDAQEGIRDGTFQPHLTVGQAGPSQSSIDRLVDQVGRIEKISWSGIKLAVLKRLDSGKMEVVEELGIGDVSVAEEEMLFKAKNIWKPCYSNEGGLDWTKPSGRVSQTSASSNCQILTYNIMAEPLAPKFESRLPYIIEAVKSTAPSSDFRVLCLQEVSDESLPLILQHPYISKTFPFSSHKPSSLLPSHRNLIILATNYFVFHTLPFLERHKSTLIADFEHPGVIVANVHLTSSLTDRAVKIKIGQMQVLTDFLNKLESRKKQFIAGDFNLTSSSRTISSALAKSLITEVTAKSIEEVINPEFWSDLFTSSDLNLSSGQESYNQGEEGATFDRLGNFLAALTDSPIENRPERYDRVLSKRGNDVELVGFEIIGRPDRMGNCGSDHYGISTIFDIKFSQMDKGNLNMTSNPENAAIYVVEDSTDIESYLAPFLPTALDQQQRGEAISLLEETIRASDRTSNVLLAPLGSYRMETYFPTSDVDILAIGSISPRDFFDFASARLKVLGREGAGDFRGVHFVNSLVSIIEVSILGIRFDLQYCEAPELLKRYHSNAEEDLNTLLFDEKLISSLPTTSFRPLNTLRDTAYLMNTIPNIVTYRAAHRFLSLYLKQRGLYSAKCGYLGGIHLSLMLNRVIKVIDLNKKSDFTSAAAIIRTFFKYYAAFNWGSDNILDPVLPEHQKVQRLSRDAVLIQSLHIPTARRNVASSCTKLTGQTLTKEFSVVSEKLQSGDWTWCLRPKDAGLQDFLDSFGAFIRVEVNIWDVDEISVKKVREMIGGVESKFPKLLVSLSRIEGLDGRAWPGRLCTTESEADHNPESELKGCYLVGVSSHREGMDSEQKKIFSGKVMSAMREFEATMRTGREFEDGNILISMNLIPRKKVLIMDLVNDERDWGNFENLLGDLQAEVEIATINVGSLAHRSSNRPLKRAPLRPAQDIISRIYWDSSFSATDFLIGYEDRFVGVKEVELTRWKSEQTDEEFIPMHRIVWIRRRESTGGETVWDRRKKLDLIFGSGISHPKVTD